jgi:N,N'-diacetyllegionaminate synthase
MGFSFENFSKTGFVIGEIAQSHDGSLGQCYAYVDAVAKAGGHSVKFQTHIADAESTPGEPWRVKFSKQDESRFDYWKRMEFTKEQWKGLKEYTESKGLVFLSSAFSFEAVDLLEEIGMVAWKLASGEINNYPLLEKIAATKKPVMISSGMSYWKELDKAVELFKSKNIPYAIMQCTSAYPCPPEQIGLNIISEMKERYACPVGLSDHSGTIYPGLAAAALGMDILEVHITFHKGLFGPDVPASVTMEEFHQLVEGVKNIKTMLANPINKDEKAKDLQVLRNLFTKSVVCKSALSKGTVITADMLTFKKPGTGFPAERVNELLGKKLLLDVEVNHFLKLEDLA